MKLKVFIRILLVLPLLLMSSACVTTAVWTDAISARREPAHEPQLRVFNAEHKQDLMVVYREYSEREDSVRTRAYLVYKNEDRVRRQKRPEFVNAARGDLLPVVPVLAEPMTGEGVQPETLYVVPSTNRFGFAVYSGERRVSDHQLPVYPEQMNGVAKAALTPLAVAADAGLIWGWLWLMSHDSDSCD